MRIRDVNTADAAALAEIYRRYIHTNITFETVAPTAEEFAGRVAEITRKYPYLAAEEDGVLIGYAYAHEYRARVAYRWSAELSVYLAPDARHRGIGRALNIELMSRLQKMGVRMAYSCIVAGNEDSIRLYRNLGFREVGTFTDSGWKNGQWLDTVWFEKRLNDSEEAPKPL